MTEEALAPAPAADEPIAQEAPQVEDKAQDAPETEPAKEPAKDEAPKRSKNPREALEKAFKADIEADDKPKPKAEAKPPDAPEVKPAAQKDATTPAEKPQEAKPEAKAEKPPAHHAAPSRFSAEAKAEWEKAPENVRAETYRALREMEQGIQKKDEILKPIEPFIKMAKDGGTTIDKALNKYVNMENMLRQNPAQGLRALAQNMGWTPQQMAATLTGQQAGQPDPRDQELQQLRQTVQQMQQQFGQVSQTVQQQRESAVLQTVEQFAAQNPRFDELAPEIERLLKTGYADNLADAYIKAERLNPAPPPPVTPAAPPAQTRQARSLTGAPSPGSNPATARTPSKSPREALSRAFGA